MENYGIVCSHYDGTYCSQYYITSLYLIDSIQYCIYNVIESRAQLGFKRALYWVYERGEASEYTLL